MCTAISITAGDNYFGRNLDYEISFGEKVTVTPRKYKFKFRNEKETDNHFAMIGMAIVKNNYPLYFDATNEKGLSVAGLRFAGNAVYNKKIDGRDNVASFEFIPYILACSKTVDDAERLLKNINITNEAFDNELKPSPLHWIISDRERSITLESVKEGIRIYENPVGVLTNNPAFDYHMFNLNNYMSLTKGKPANLFAGNNSNLQLKTYSRGMGALGLPGDASSMSRFVRATFVKMNSVSGDSESESVSQFFHILKSVEMQRGCVHTGKDLFSFTIYSSCCNTDRGIYYYSTYDNSQIYAVDLNKENLQGNSLIAYSLKKNQIIEHVNDTLLQKRLSKNPNV